MRGSFVLRLTGGIFSFLSGISAFMVADIAEAFNSAFGSTIDTSTLRLMSVPLAFLAGILGIIGGMMGKRRGGVILIIGGILAFIATFLFGILPCTLMIVGGVLALREKELKAMYSPRRIEKSRTYYADVVQQRSASPSYSKPRPRPRVAQQDYTTIEKIYCTYCGAENRADARFCRKCGKPMD